ncbi:hypothetical protein ABZ890_43980 [Streptomyces sp. NPDC046984]|uniref:hypothetical protein n=1 Tax=Streptomyces sp. NPDC046984 TaxID=3155138 RepID=UPI0033C65859
MDIVDPDPIGLADEIARQLNRLTELLAQLPACQALEVIARSLEPVNGVLGGFANLVANGSKLARYEAERGALPAEVWLAFGRATTELDALGAGIEEHADTLKRCSVRSHTRADEPHAAAPLVVRKHR